MRFEIVVGLHKGLLRRLPVGRQGFLHMQLDAASLQRKILEMLHHNAEVVFQRFGVPIHIDKHETAPARAEHFLQTVLGIGDMGEIPAPGNIANGAVEMPGPAVERAGKPLTVVAALPVQQSCAAVRTGVEIRLDGVVVHAGNDD